MRCASLSYSATQSKPSLSDQLASAMDHWTHVLCMKELKLGHVTGQRSST